MLALIHESPATHRVAERFIDQLREVGERLAVFSDSDQWRGVPNVRFRSFHDNGRELETEEIRRQGAEWQDANRIIFDIQADLKPIYEVGGQPLRAKGVQPPPPGRVEGWRGVPKAGPICCSPFPLGVPHQPSREPVSNPRHVERSRRFSRTPLSCSLHLKAYVAYPLGSAFGGRLTR